MPRFLWTQKQDFGPKPRTGHAMAFDAGRGKVILFGGDSLKSKFGDTWEWDGEFWTQMSDMGPAPRIDHAMAYNADKAGTIIFGGTSADDKQLGDTWNWDGEAWTQLSNSGPEPRSGHAMVYNTADNTILLFGGQASTLEVLGDTWQFDGEAWTQLEETGPSSRKFHSMAYDTVRGRVVLFGGTTNDSSLGDTWEWNGSAWIQTADFGPAGCLSSAIVFTNTRATLYGGISSISANPAPPPVIFDNSWDWDGKHWTQRQDIGPGARWGHAMSFDSKRSCIVLFGGLPVFGTANLFESVLGDTWEHTDVSAPVVPPSAITIVSLNINPNTLLLGQPVNVVVTVTLSDIITEATVPISVFSLPKRIADMQPTPPNTQPTLLGSILVQVNSSTGEIQFPSAGIAETAVIFVPQLGDPQTLISEILTVINA